MSDPALVAEHLAALVRIPTVAVRADEPEPAEVTETFARHRAALEEFYPRLFATATVETVGRHGLLMRLAGAGAERPMVLMAHQDVVPVPEAWEAEGWEHEPFGGVIAAGCVHGRGTLDDKGALVVLCEAVESLLGEGWAPDQDLYVLLGADEEVYGDNAIAATALLEERGVSPYLVLDEGGAVTLGALPGVDGEVAVVGVSEKGIATVELIADSGGGHASTPPRESAAGILARAISRIESHPFPAELGDVPLEMFREVRPRTRGGMRLALGLIRPLRPLMARVLGRVTPETSAMVRTTQAVTMLSGSTAHNVLATSAHAIINLRVAVGMTVADAVARVERTVADPRVTVRLLESSEPSPVSPRGDDPRWLAINAAIAHAYPEALTVPYIMLAASDARHVARIAPAVYRFAPLRMTAAQRAAVHGPNEKVELESLGRGVEFYRALLTRN